MGHSNKDQIEALYRRLRALEYEAAETGPSEGQRLRTLAVQRADAVEELHVAMEELRQQNEELALAQQSVEDERRRYQELFDCAPDGYLVTDVQGVILEANRAAVRLLNVPQPDLTGKPLFLFLAAHERKSFYTRLSQLLKTCQREEWEVWLQPGATSLWWPG